jgi:hypothetical protein
MAKTHDPDITLQDYLDIIVQAVNEYTKQGGKVYMTPLRPNPVTASPATLIINIPGVEAVGNQLILVEYATNATNAKSG